MRFRKHLCSAFLPGEAFQFHWSEDSALIGGERTKLQVAHFKLSYSRTFILRGLSVANPRDASAGLSDSNTAGGAQYGPAMPARGDLSPSTGSPPGSGRRPAMLLGSKGTWND
jgi:hypothetical protein